jgi:ATP-binding cassette subfamily B protein
MSKLQKETMNESPDLSKIGQKPSMQEQMRTFPRLARMAYQADPSSFVLMILGLLVETPVSALVVYSTARIIDVLGGADPASAWFWIIVLIVTWFVKNASDVLYVDRLEHVRQKLVITLEDRLLTHMSKLSYGVLEDSSFQSLAMVINRRQHQAIVAFENVIDFLAHVAGLIGMFTVVFYVPWPVAIILIIATAIRFHSSQKLSILNWGIFDFETREGRRVQYYRNTIENPRTLLQTKGVGLTDVFIRQWRKLAGKLLEKRIQERKVNSWYMMLTLQIDNIGLGLGMAVLAPDVIAGLVPLSSFVVFMTSYSRILPNMRELSRKYQRILVDTPVISFIFRLLDVPPEQDKGETVGDEPIMIRFENVRFRYPGTDTDVLKGVNFELREGDRVAIVGLNGAGKSTILKLLMGVYSPTSGRILVNGTPLEKIKPSNWRRALAVMGQDAPYYSDTATEQIWYGDREEKLDKQHLDESIEASGFDEIVTELPRGLQTYVGKHYAMPEDQAIELSGGQNQILTIARTLYRDARIYVFDEPTSAVDAEKEESFFSRLPETLAGKAIIFVSHRFSTLRRAKRILVLEEGRLIEDGTHEELLELKGRYAELFTLQAKNYQ